MGGRENERDVYGAALVDWMLAVAPTRTLSDRFAEQELRERLLGVRDELKLGRYLLRDRLPARGEGLVFRARDPRHDRDVAVKLLLRPRQGPEDLMSSLRLAREARALARLNHPNVVAVHDIGTFDHDEYDSGLFMVMELVAGRSLAEVLEHERVTMAWLVDLFVQAARGLAAAHRVGIAHRDFGADKVVVGDDGRARVRDFGLTQDRVEARCDQHSFCAALYEAVYGAAPESDPLFRRRSRRGKVPPWLVAVMRRGLQADPSERFADMDELGRALEAGRRRGPRSGALVGLAVAIGLGTLVGWVAVRETSIAVERGWRGESARSGLPPPDGLRARDPAGRSAGTAVASLGRPTTR